MFTKNQEVESLLQGSLRKKRQGMLRNRLHITDVMLEVRDSERESDFKAESSKYWFRQVEFTMPAGHLQRAGK